MILQLDKIGAFEDALLSYAHAEHQELLSKIVESGLGMMILRLSFKALLENFKSTQTW